MEQTAAAAAGPAPIEHRQVLIVFSGLLMVMLLAALDSTIVATALPTIVGELGGLAHLSWVVTAYLLAQTIATPLYGKLGDLYGRKIVLQSGIILFLAGSALCGLSQNMTQLILFRAVQGLGGGGLIVTTQAVVGDIVSPRERGRYQGIFGAVYGLASIAGPLLGGFFTTHLTWRWIFYINLPLGIAAIVVLAATLPARAERVRHAIDFAGAALLAVALSTTTIVADVGGTAYPWSSPRMLALVAAAVISAVGFILVERRAAEPVLPLRLFRNPTFAVASAIGLIIGFALFGSVTYLPVFLQIVNGSTPTESGLEMMPMMLGMLVTSVVSGQLISRSGRYKRFPIMGTAVMSVGLFLLSRMTASTSILTAAAIMLLLGLGLGMVMQVLVIAVQNAVGYGDLGVATSGATLFRLIGGSLGTAVLGAIFASRLATHLADFLPAGVATSAGITPQSLSRLPAAVQTAYAHSFTLSLGTVFLVATVIGVIGFALTCVLPEHTLRATIAARTEEDLGADVGEAFAMPVDSESMPPFLRGLAALADRDVQRRYIDAITARAGVDLTAAAAWLLMRLELDPHLDVAALGRKHHVAHGTMEAALAQLAERGLIRGGTGESVEPRELTADGCDTLERMVRARRERLAELQYEWPVERREDMHALLNGLARELIPDAPRHNANGPAATADS